jgi:hypothetical protein
MQQIHLKQPDLILGLFMCMHSYSFNSPIQDASSAVTGMRQSAASSWGSKTGVNPVVMPELVMAAIGPTVASTCVLQ